MSKIQNEKKPKNPKLRLPQGGLLHQVLDEGFLQKFCEKWRHGYTISGQFDSRFEQLGPGQLAVLSVKGLVASQLTRNTNPGSTCVKKI